MPDNEDTTVQPIKDIVFTGDAGNGEVALFLTGADDASRGYTITPATLRAILPSLISLAATWSGEPDFSTEGMGGTQNALMARRILFARGRDDSEAAVRVFLGKDLDFTYLMPLNLLMNAFNLFAQNVTRSGPKLN